MRARFSFGRVPGRGAFNLDVIRLHVIVPRTPQSLPPFAFANALLPPCTFHTHPMSGRLARPLRRNIAFPQCVAFGAALRGGCAAARRSMPMIEPFFFLRQDDLLPQVSMLLPTFSLVSPIPVLFLWASLRDQAALWSPLRGLHPSGGHPSPLRSLRSLRVPCPAVRCAHRRLRGRRCRALLRRLGTSSFLHRSLVLRAPLVSGCAVAIRPASSAFAVANAASLPSRLLASAQSPLRLPVGSLPEPISPALGTPDQVHWTAFAGPTLTPDAARCPVHFDLARTTPDCAGANN